MPEKFVIEGGKKLEGEVEVRGSKNAAGAILAATLLTDQACIIDNLPLVSDILNLIEILKNMGVEVDWLGERKVKIRCGERVDPAKMDFEKVSKSRVSVLLMGGLLPRFKEFKIARPGGDRIGLRPITIHLQALGKLGVDIEEKGDFYYLKSQGLRAREVFLPEFSVTATENLVMSSVLTEGNTTIKGAAQEPQVQDLCKMLLKMGARIEGIGTHTLKIQGVKRLEGVNYKIMPDLIEAGSFLVIGAGAGKKVKVKNLVPNHLDSFFAKLQEMGVEFKKNNDSVEIFGVVNLKPVKVQALPFPGFPTDLLPLVVPLLTQAVGKSLIHDPLYEYRFNYIQQLRKMGADIEIVDPHRAIVFGPTPLFGVTIESWDIRAGASLVVAGLMAQGKTTIENIEQIDRGYERIEERLQKLGASIKRVES
ncbi:UDP-N-acetylglucosamine 1-carboxyvinyltransferase [bacterium]|nr:UDP-N-acetylglucosamine 1-carboxyvinyltransferase [bacterium]